VLACDRVGTGRMAEPSQLLPQIQSLLITQGQRDLAGRSVLISAGGTREWLDPVRFIGNPSTGKMGVALAQAASHRGARVTLVHGRLEAGLLDTLPLTTQRILVDTSAAMQQAMVDHLPQAELIVMSAAVADVQPRHYNPTKMPKADLPEALPLAPVPDIVAHLASLKQPHQTLVGFAAQTGDILTPAKEKLHRKQLDAIAANPIDQPNSGFGGALNQLLLLDRSGRQWSSDGPQPKLVLAHRLYDFVQTIAV
jgi:phosphopantothenoylcysteine decarboxylase / phosphopantothenate---cysteine ligase